MTIADGFKAKRARQGEQAREFEGQQLRAIRTLARPEDPVKARKLAGRSLATMECVHRTQAIFFVKDAPTAQDRRESIVYRHPETSEVLCNCPEFDRERALDPEFRCQHIYAVKYFLTGRLD